MLQFFMAAATSNDQMAASPMGGMPTMLIMLVLFIAIFYFMILRPEKK